MEQERQEQEERERRYREREQQIEEHRFVRGPVLPPATPHSRPRPAQSPTLHGQVHLGP